MEFDRMIRTGALAIPFFTASAMFAGHGCYRVDPLDGSASTDGDSDGDGDGDDDLDPLDGVDLLVMVDNSSSMAEEQAILAPGVMALVNALANPLTEGDDLWGHPAVDAMRIAVVTSDMGVSYGDAREIPSEGETPVSLQDYRNRGDDGAFRGIAEDVVSVASGTIECDETAAQCPPGWACEGIDDGVGACESDVTAVPCPVLDGAWAETTSDGENVALNVAAACLARQGTEGCGFEQQLESVAVGLSRDDQQSFLVDSHLLAIVLVTDEEDCSMENAPGLFGTPECDDQLKLNIACNHEGNEEYLYSAQDFHQKYVAAKGDPGAVVFAAFAGVPPTGEEGAEACQGKGSAIGDCLEQEAMQYEEYQETDGTWRFTPVCERYEDGLLVTAAVPGRRYVELAQEFGARGFVTSICTAGWAPAFEDLAEMIAEQIAASNE